MSASYIRFTEEMKKEYTVLCPNMLPMHFELILQILRNEGYKAELLKTRGPEIIETGLRYVHNDTCYPATLVIGQFIDAIQSGKYDPHKTALIMFQTGGGCRASNYIFLIRKALERAGYPYVPVISFSLNNIEDHPGFKMRLPILHKMLYCLFYADLLMSLVNQVRPYEKNKGEAERLASRLTEEIAADMRDHSVSFRRLCKDYPRILDAFAAIEREEKKTVRVGVVGEIYVKYSPLANNNLVDFLIENGAEVTVPGLVDFFLFTIRYKLVDHDLYHMHPISIVFYRLFYRFMASKQKKLIEIMKKDGRFHPGSPFDITASEVKEYISLGCKMGEGWLLPAEIIELAHSGVKNVVCAQPFGCLPNHICGKGMMKPIKDKNPDVNIVAIDYDASATRVNQENRLKLMLANAFEALEAEEAAQSAEAPAKASAEAPIEASAEAPTLAGVK